MITATRKVKTIIMIEKYPPGEENLETEIKTDESSIEVTVMGTKQYNVVLIDVVYPDDQKSLESKMRSMD